jgi:hypothetical protein
MLKKISYEDGYGFVRFVGTLIAEDDSSGE